MLLRDLHNGMAQDDRNPLDQNASQKHIDRQRVPKPVCVSTYDARIFEKAQKIIPPVLSRVFRLRSSIPEEILLGDRRRIQCFNYEVLQRQVNGCSGFGSIQEQLSIHNTVPANGYCILDSKSAVTEEQD